MQDPLGCYYYPDPSDKNTRMYVRLMGGEIEFRMWHGEHAQIWERHGWIPYEVARRAADMRPDKAQALSLYDMEVAQAVLATAERSRKE